MTDAAEVPWDCHCPAPWSRHHYACIRCMWCDMVRPYDMTTDKRGQIKPCLARPNFDYAAAGAKRRKASQGAKIGPSVPLNAVAP